MHVDRVFWRPGVSLLPDVGGRGAKIRLPATSVSSALTPTLFPVGIATIIVGENLIEKLKMVKN